MDDTVNQTGFEINLYDIGAGEKPDEVYENQCCNPDGEQHFFCSQLQWKEFEVVGTPQKKTGDYEVDTGMIIKCFAKAQQKHRE